MFGGFFKNAVRGRQAPILKKTLYDAHITMPPSTVSTCPVT